MSISIASKAVNILYSDSVDYPRLEKIFKGLQNLGIEADLREFNVSEVTSGNSFIQLEDKDNASNITILTYKFNETETIEKLISDKSKVSDLIIIRLDDSKFDVKAENLFHIDATIFSDELTVKWVCKKVSFLQNFSETSRNLLSRALHWSENKHDVSLILDKEELFEYVEWLEQTIEGNKQLNNLSLKQEYVAFSREYHYPLSNAYLHCGGNNPGVAANILQWLRSSGYEVISGNFISPNGDNQKFNDYDIRRSKNFLFIYSSKSNQNNECKRVVSYAMSMNKRIITLISPEMKNQALLPQLDKNNVVQIPTDWMFHQEFIKQVEEKLNVEDEYVEKHTRYLVKSLIWIEHKKNYKDLLKSKEVVEAGEWVAKAEELNLSPSISPLQKLFIDKSIAAYSLNKNLKLGAVMLGVLLLFLGILFFLFIENSQSASIDQNDQKFIFKKVNSPSTSNDFFNSWKALKSSKTARNVDFLKLYYGNSRFLKQIGSTYKTITNLEFSSDGNKVLLAYGQNYFDLLDREGNLLQRFEVNDHQIFKAGFDIEEKRIISSGTREKLCIWETDGTLLRETNPGKQLVCRDFIFIGNTARIAFKISDKKILITDFELNKISEIINDRKVVRVSVRENNNSLIVITENEIFTYRENYQNAIELKKLPFEIIDACLVNEKVFAIAKDGKFCVKDENKEWKFLKMQDINATTIYYDKKQSDLYTLSTKNGIKRWNLNGDLISNFKLNNIINYRLLKPIDNQSIIISGTDATGKTLLYELPTHPPLFEKIAQLNGTINQIAYFKKDQIILISDMTITLFDLNENRVIWEKKGKKKWSCAATSKKNRLLAAGDHIGNIYIIDSLGNTIHQLKAHKKKVNKLAFHPNGEELISAGSDRFIVKLNKEGQVLFKSKKHRSAVNFVGFSRNGNHFLSTGDDQEIIIWENNGKLYNKLKGPASSGIFADFSKSASFIVSLGLGGDYTFWDIEGNIIRFERNLDGEKPIKTFFANDGESVILCEQNKVKGVDAKGNNLFTIDLPDNIEILDVYQSPATFDYVQVLAKDKHKNSFFAAQLSTNVEALEKGFIDEVKPSI